MEVRNGKSYWSNFIFRLSPHLSLSPGIFNGSHRLQSIENHIWSLAALSWIFAYYHPSWPQDPVLRTCHIHRSTIRVSISVLKNTFSIFYKATSPQNPHHSLEPLALLPQNILRHAILPCLSRSVAIQGGKHFFVLCPSLLIQVTSALSNSYLVLLLLPILHHKMPRRLSEDGRALLGWGRAWEEAEPWSQNLLSSRGITGGEHSLLRPVVWLHCSFIISAYFEEDLQSQSEIWVVFRNQPFLLPLTLETHALNSGLRESFIIPQKPPCAFHPEYLSQPLQPPTVH